MSHAVPIYDTYDEDAYRVGRIVMAVLTAIAIVIVLASVVFPRLDNTGASSVRTPATTSVMHPLF